MAAVVAYGMAELIITNGDSTAGSMREAGFPEEIFCWKDVLHDGPVPAVAWDELADIRSRFLAAAFGEPLAEIRKDFHERDRILARLKAFDKVILWFEHDLYDQLQLCQILDYLNGLNRPPSVHLMQSETYLGIIPPPQLPACRDTVRPLTSQEITDGSRFWQIFTGTDPRKLHEFIDYTGPLKFLPAITKRLLQTFPFRDNGLTLTQRYTLKHLLKGAKRVASLFGDYWQEEEIKYLGDWSFVKYLEELAFCPSPLIDGFSVTLSRESAQKVYQQSVALTATGRDVLHGKQDHIALNGIDRWIGGTHLTPENLYCYDPGRERLVKVEKV